MAEPQFGVGAGLAESAGSTAVGLDKNATENAQKNSSNALQGAQQVTSFTQDLAKQQQADQAKQQIALMRYNQGHFIMTPAMATGLAPSLGPSVWQMIGQDVDGHMIMPLAITNVKAQASKDVADTKADSAEDVAGTNADAKTDAATIAANAKTQVQTMKNNAPPKPAGGANAGLKTDEDAHKYADQWNDRAEKSEQKMMGTFQKKLGLPEDASLGDVMEKWVGLSDDKKNANRAAFGLAIQHYEHDRDTYNQYAKAAGQQPYPEDADGINQLKKLAGSAPASGGTIKVRDKKTGQTGSMPADKFDPSKYEKVNG